MLQSISAQVTDDFSDFVQDHPTEVYAAAGAIILLLILFLMVRNRRAKQKVGAGKVSRRDQKRAAKKAEAEGRTMEIKSPPSEAKAESNGGDGAEEKDEKKKPGRKERRENRKAKRKRIAEEKRRAEDEDRRAWEEERNRRREERQRRKDERQRRKGERKLGAPVTGEDDSEEKETEKADGPEKVVVSAFGGPPPSKPIKPEVEDAEEEKGDETPELEDVPIGILDAEAEAPAEEPEEPAEEPEEPEEPEESRGAARGRIRMDAPWRQGGQGRGRRDGSHPDRPGARDRTGRIRVDFRRARRGGEAR